jgi:transcriptional regulator with XRE-family HTH domain
MTNFGTYLKNARRGAKRTQSDVAEALGKSRGTVIAIEQGKVLPKNVMEVVRLAKFLRLDELEAISNYAEAKMFEGEDERAESASEKGQGFFGGMAATVARLQGRRNDERENEIVEVSPKSNEQIEDRVSGIVLSVVDEQEYERGGLPIVGIMQSEQRLNEIAQESGVRYPVRFEVADDSEWWEASTVFEDDALTVYVRDDVFCRADEGRGRDRWTMSHELGHVVLHGNQLARSSSGRMFRDYG